MKKLVSLALAAVLAVSTVGCGSSSDSSSSTADSAQSTEAAADGATFKIGGIGPITGGAAIYGQAVMNAAQMAVDKINADGSSCSRQCTGLSRGRDAKMCMDQILKT